MQDHVHARQAAGCCVLFLAVERDLGAGFFADLEQQRTRPTCRVIHGGGVAGCGAADACNFGDDAADFGRGVELALALAAIHGEMLHQVFVGIAEDVVAVGTILREIQRRVLKDGDQLAQAVNHLLATAQLAGIVEVRHVGQFVGVGQRGNDPFVDQVADLGIALERHHVGKAGTGRHLDGRKRLVGVFVADILDEQHDQHVVLVLAGIHAAAQGVTGGPERRVKLGFLDGHWGS